MDDVPKREYTNISIPNSLIDDVRLIVEGDIHGYTSIAEFIKDAIRRRISDVT